MWIPDHALYSSSLHSDSIIFIPVPGLLWDFRTASWFAHDNTVDSEHRDSGFRAKLNRPCLRREWVVDLCFVGQ